MAGLALIGALTWSQPDRDLKGGQSGNPFQIGSFFIYFQLGSRAPHTIFGFEKSDKIAQDPPIFRSASAITIDVHEDCSSDLLKIGLTSQGYNLR